MIPLKKYQFLEDLYAGDFFGLSECPKQTCILVNQIICKSESSITQTMSAMKTVTHKSLIRLGVILGMLLLPASQTMSNLSGINQALTGTYSGYSEPYSAGKIGNRDIMVPGIQHTFQFMSGGVVTLTQKGDNGTVASYRGKVTSNSIKDGVRVVLCSVVEVNGGANASRPDYRISFKPDGTIDCEENPGARMSAPLFHLEKK